MHVTWCAMKYVRACFTVYKFMDMKFYLSVFC